jgi:CheY-like chemotaxis protein
MKAADIQICLIDDDPIYSFTTQVRFKNAGFEKKILEFQNGENAFFELLPILQSQPSFIDIIFLDINMPIWDGWDFLDELQKINIDHFPPIIMVSSSNNPDDKERSSQYASVVAFEEKPLLPEKVMEILQNL